MSTFVLVVGVGDVGLDSHIHPNVDLDVDVVDGVHVDVDFEVDADVCVGRC